VFSAFTNIIFAYPQGCAYHRLGTTGIDSRSTDVGKVVSFTLCPLFTLQEDYWYSFLSEAKSIAKVCEKKLSWPTLKCIKWLSKTMKNFNQDCRRRGRYSEWYSIPKRMLWALPLEPVCWVDGVLWYAVLPAKKDIHVILSSLRWGVSVVSWSIGIVYATAA
jgi:hypothetical protein